MTRQAEIAKGWPAAELTQPGHRMGHRNVEVEPGLYVGTGIVWRVCPRLLELDKRHGQHHGTWPAAWRTPRLWDGRPNPVFLVDPEGHDANTFHYVPGSRPENDAEWPVCGRCGRRLVCSDGDPI